MFSPVTGLYWPDSVKRPSIKTHEKLIGIEAAVHEDGDATSFAVNYTNHKPFRVHVGIEEIPPILHEIRSAALAMMRIQAMKLDRGKDKLLEIAERALRPIDLQVLIDPLTADRVWVMQFNEHAPLAIRQTPHEIVNAKLLLAQAEAAALH